jgi:hypothetical protein
MILETIQEGGIGAYAAMAFGALGFLLGAFAFFAKVTACGLARFKAMKFPRPDGGGEVIVKYPFIFKSAN